MRSCRLSVVGSQVKVVSDQLGLGQRRACRRFGEFADPLAFDAKPLSKFGKKTLFFLLTTDHQPLTTAISSQIFVAAAFVFQTMEFDVGGYERSVT